MDLEPRMREVEQAIVRIETVLPTLPTKVDLAQLQAKLEQDLAGVQLRLEQDLARLQSRIERPLWIAVGLFTAALAIGGFFLDRTWNVIVALLRASGA